MEMENNNTPDVSVDSTTEVVSKTSGETTEVSILTGKKLDKKKIIIIASILVVALLVSALAVTLSLLGGGTKADAFVIMTEELDGLFNPFFSTTAADSTIVSMTQIGMLTSKYENGQAVVAYGDDQAVVTKDFEITHDDQKNTTTYTFVHKNGIKYSDGKPLTINDVLFNLYVYLDPVYTGSATMYSTDILGLAEYRSQTIGANSNIDDQISEQARDRANTRNKELINLFNNLLKANKGGVDYETMKTEILKKNLSAGYKKAVSADTNSVTSEQLLKDYDLALKYFLEELNSDYANAQEAYKEAPYKNYEEFNDPIFCYMCYEGFVTIKYAENGKDKTKIESFDINYSRDAVTNKDQAIKHVYDYTIENKLDQILQYWGTSQKLLNEYIAKAREVILQEKVGTGGLKVKNISGIVSLGHTSDLTEITVGENKYTIAREHNEDGSPKNAGEYDVLQITINGVDPKAVWNFSFAVAPQHYYAEGYDVDIANNKFGVDFGSYSFMTDVIQSTRNIKVPVGAGAYKATNANNEDNPDGTAFFANNVVYFKANNYFETVGAEINNAKIEKVRYRVVSASNALNALESGEVHYVTPQLTNDNIAKIEALKSKGVDSTYTDQLGYGYIGINAGKVPDINIRKAIMTAMDTSLAINYYKLGTASRIFWPMSKVSWAYPDGTSANDNSHSYPAINFNEDAAKAAIEDYMLAAGVSAGDKELEIKFTIAGTNLTDHPTYAVFARAAEILNECGWKIEVVADSQALTKLSTGSLSVWAAAWGSTIDPDLYQVYHKNSTATSVLAWGYREILANPGQYSVENGILTQLSDVIDAARATNDQKEREDLYEQAMKYILDLAIELPVYQRSVLYAYNTKVINKNSLPTTVNPYSSPLDRIWEIEFAG